MGHSENIVALRLQRSNATEEEGVMGILVDEELQQAWRCGANSQNSDRDATSQVWHKEALPHE